MRKIIAASLLVVSLGGVAFADEGSMKYCDISTYAIPGTNGNPNDVGQVTAIAGPYWVPKTGAPVACGQSFKAIAGTIQLLQVDDGDPVPSTGQINTTGSSVFYGNPNWTVLWNRVTQQEPTCSIQTCGKDNPNVGQANGGANAPAPTFDIENHLAGNLSLSGVASGATGGIGWPGTYRIKLYYSTDVAEGGPITLTRHWTPQNGVGKVVIHFRDGRTGSGSAYTQGGVCRLYNPYKQWGYISATIQSNGDCTFSHVFSATGLQVQVADAAGLSSNQYITVSVPPGRGTKTNEFTVLLNGGGNMSTTPGAANDDTAGSGSTGTTNVLDKEWWTNLFKSLFIPQNSTLDSWRAFHTKLTEWGPLGYFKLAFTAWNNAPGVGGNGPDYIQGPNLIPGIPSQVRIDLGPESFVGRLMVYVRGVESAFVITAFLAGLYKWLRPRLSL